MKTDSRLLLLALLLACAMGIACERPPVEAEQGNFRGLAVEQVRNPRTMAAKLAANRVPEPLAPVEPGSPPSSLVYQNVQVLGDVPVAEFTRLMAAMTTWVSPEQGCTYCHAAGESLASDSLYTKVVARRMLQMTRAINTDWQDHVGMTGVTCYTCHRGQPVPSQYWYREGDKGGSRSLVGGLGGQNMAGEAVGLASLPGDPFDPYLLGDRNIRVQSPHALPRDSRRSIKHAEQTYGLMMHVSNSLGVNCTYCHNSRAFSPWQGSSPARVTAWYGIRMARNVNDEYMESLTDVFPDHRKGPQGDVFKVHCGTCHQGLPKPLGGVSMLQDYAVLGAYPEPPAPASSTGDDEEESEEGVAEGDPEEVAASGS